MAKLNFPGSPTPGTIYTENGNVWKWNGSSWISFNSLDLTSQVAGELGVTYGGTGYSTYTLGDILVGAGSSFIKLPVGSDNFILTASSSSSTGLTWSQSTASSATGFTTLNNLTSGVQYFSAGTSGSLFNISSSGSTHTFNIPIAGSGATGLVSTQSQTFAGQKTFTSSIIGDLSGTATTSNYSLQSGYGITAGTSALATTSTYSHQAGYAVTSGSSSTASTATYAHQSGYAITAISSTTATSASYWTTPRTLNLSGDLSGSVIWSGSGDTTISATIAANSVALGTDTTGQYASTISASGSGITVTTASADDGTAYTIYSSATSSNNISSIVLRDSSGNFSAGTINASLTGTASTSTYSHQSGYAITSDSSTNSGLATTSTYAHQSGYATTSGSSGTATTATYANQSGYGITAGTASTSTYSLQSGYGITSGTATTAQNINVIAANTNSNHVLLFTPTSGSGSGLAVSSNSTLVYNPSTEILSVSGLAVTSGTLTTSSSSGSLIITGGVGIGSSLNVLGRVGIGTNSHSAQINVRNSSSSTIGIIIQGATSQSADYLQILSSSGATTFSINSSGRLSWPSSSTAQIYNTSYSSQGRIVVSGNLYVNPGPFIVDTGAGEASMTSTAITFGGVGWGSYGSPARVSTDNAVRIQPTSTSVVPLVVQLQNASWTSGNAFEIQNNGALKFNVDYAGNTVLLSSTAATNSSSGALVVTGGVGIGGSLFVAGDLTINGTTTTINSVTLTVDDKNIELGSVTSPSDVTAEGGGITLKGLTDKFINWYTGTGWSSSESWNLISGNTYKINNTTVLSASSIGTGITNSSLTALGIITTGVWSGTAITPLYGGTGLQPTFTVGDILYANSSTTWNRLTPGTNGFVLTSAGTANTPTYTNPSNLSVGLATTASNSRIASAGNSNSAHSILFTPASNTSGSAISSDSTLSFNPSTEILSVSGLAITSGTASTNTTTGALIVRGGLGVTGQLSFATASFGFTGITTNPVMSFIGATSSSPITLTVQTDNSLNWEGSSGSLFSIDNNLSSGEIFAVSDISGLPIISASAGQTVNINEFGGYTQIGNGTINSSTTSNGSLVIAGGLGMTGNANIGGTVRISSGTNSASTSSGSLVVLGGLGITGNAFIGGTTTITSGTNSFSTTTGALVVNGGLGVTGNANIGGTVRISSTIPTTSSATGAFSVAGGVGIGQSLIVGGNVSVSNIINSGTNTFTKAGFASGDILLDNGSVDTPGVLFYWGNNRNIGIDAFYSGSGTTRFRIVKELNETGGAEIWSVDRNGIVSQTAWAPGEIIKMTVLVGSDLTGSNPTTINSTSNTDVASYSYTPVSSNSYLLIEFITRYEIAGAAADDFVSRIAVDSAEQSYNIQYWINGAGGGTRSGTLFPLMARYTNSNTTAKTISITVRRGSSDDNATVYKDTTTVMKITEIGR